MTFEKLGKQPEKNAADSTDAGPSALQAEGWKIKPGNSDVKQDVEQELKQDLVQDVDKLYGGKDQYLAKAPEDLRQQYNLPKDASSSKVYQAMAHDSVGLFGYLTAKEKTQALTDLRLTAPDMKNERKIYEALIARDRRDGGLPVMTPEQLKADGGLGIKQAEQALHKSSYDKAKKYGIAIDFN